MHELAVSAFASLERAELADVLDHLHTRVFDRPPNDLINVELVDGVWQWQFKPFVELMLRHITDTAANSSLSVDARRAEVHGVLDMLGF
jgi:hypothetical protein